MLEVALKRCTEWILDHQEEQCDWAGYFPPNWGCIWALHLEGFAWDDRPMRLALEALERFSISDDHGKWFQSTNSPCWDTAFMLSALCDAERLCYPGQSGDTGRSGDARLTRAARWLWDRQLVVDHSDWRVYANTQQAGGWGFQYYNTHYPDLDDTAVVVVALIKHDPNAVAGESIANAVEWILGMQNRDGGWGAFDINNDVRYLNNSLIGDLHNLADPSTPDVTGRILQCFGLLLAHRIGGRLPERFRSRLQASATKAVRFLLKNQEKSGSWWSRWGVNYLNGTAYVLWGLENFCYGDFDARQAIIRALRWFDSCQNPDGGWGESPLSYSNTKLAGQGPSTAAQTAWAVDTMLRYRAPHDPAVERGVRWLLSHRNARPEDDPLALWPSNSFVGTGFPPFLFLGYPFYHHHYPMEALARYIDSLGHQETSESLQLSPHILSALQPHSVLMMVPGSRGDVEVFLCVAERLRESRVRIAACPDNRAAVEEHGFEFFDVGDGSDDSEGLSGQPLSAGQSLTRSWPARLLRSLNLRSQKLYRSGFDDESLAAAVPQSSVRDAKQVEQPARPFVADVVVSRTTVAHIQAARKLDVPHVIVSPQPASAPKDFPRVYTVAKPASALARWWRHLSYVCLDLVCVHFALGLLLPAPCYPLSLPILAARLQELFSDRHWSRGKPTTWRVCAGGAGADAAARAVAAQLVQAKGSSAYELMLQLRTQWQHKQSALLLSGAAAAGLVERGVLDWNDLALAPRHDWTEGERAPFGWDQLFSRIAGVLGFLIRVLGALSSWLLSAGRDGGAADEDGSGLDERDPVRRARIRQDEFELDYIRRHVDEKELVQIEEQLVQRWQASAAAKFREMFVEEK